MLLHRECPQDLRARVPGCRSPGPGPRVRVPRSGFPVRVPGSRSPGAGPQVQVPGSESPGPGPWVPGSSWALDLLGLGPVGRPGTHLGPLAHLLQVFTDTDILQVYRHPTGIQASCWYTGIVQVCSHPRYFLMQNLSMVGASTKFLAQIQNHWFCGILFPISATVTCGTLA